MKKGMPREVKNRSGMRAAGGFCVLIAAVLMIMAAVAGPAGAALITSTYTIPNQTTTPFTVDFTLDKFNTNLGTLTGINIFTQTTFDGAVDVVSIDSGAQPFTDASATVSITVSSTALPTPITTPVTATVPSGTVPAATSGYSEFTQSGLQASHGQTTAVAQSYWYLYEGTGVNTVDFTATAPYGLYAGSAAPGVFFGGSGSAGGVTTIDYTYTPVPVPPPLLLLAPGFLGLVGMRKKLKI